MEEYQDNSLRGRVFRKLREDILSGVYEDQDELREITIGEELGVSRTPVREALRQLELEGLVTIIPNKYQGKRCGRHLSCPLYAGRLVCALGNRTYYRGTDRKTGRNPCIVGISCAKREW